MEMLEENFRSNDLENISREMARYVSEKANPSPVVKGCVRNAIYPRLLQKGSDNVF
jgi:hypothetical protein